MQNLIGGEKTFRTRDEAIDAARRHMIQLDEYDFEGNRRIEIGRHKRRYLIVFADDALPIGATIVGHMQPNATFQSYTGK